MVSPVGIAIVSASNSPLLVRTTLDNVDQNEANRMMYIMHASLDIVEEIAEQPTSRNNFLGVLYQCEQYKIYGLMSTTKVKVLLTISQRHSFGPPRENDIKSMLKNIHKAYIDATAMNPFYKPNEPVKSKRLDGYLDTLFVNNHQYDPNNSLTCVQTPLPPEAAGNISGGGGGGGNSNQVVQTV